MKKKTAVILGVILIILLLIGVFFLGTRFTSKDNHNAKDEMMITNLVLDTSQNNYDKANQELADREVFFAGIGNGPVPRNGEILLKNPPSNDDIYMQYTIINEDTGEVVYETDLIQSANAVSWVPGETLEPGEYHFTLIEQPYYQVEATENWLPLTTGNNHVTITILE